MTAPPLVGAVEAGGTKIICLVGSGPDDIRAEIRLPTRSPERSIPEMLDFFRARAAEFGPLARLGVASFGPVDLDPDSAGWGHIAATPKPDWAGTDLAGALSRGLDLPVAFDTDVNGAALAEGHWGAARGLDDFVYVTVGTGIGAGAVVGGRPVHGALHPEMGHMAVPHDLVADPYAGRCPFHRDCLEGLASGPAIAERWGRTAERLPPDHPAWRLEAGYLAVLAANLVFLLSPRRIIFGGGVMRSPALLDEVRARTRERLGGYLRLPLYDGDLAELIVPPGLDDRAGPLGALALALYGAARRAD